MTDFHFRQWIRRTTDALPRMGENVKPDLEDHRGPLHYTKGSKATTTHLHLAMESLPLSRFLEPTREEALKS
jgi:hypothetical protein